MPGAGLVVDDGVAVAVEPLVVPPLGDVGVGLDPPPPEHAANASIAMPNATKEMGGFGVGRFTA
jgi:hypothetical protein